MRAILLALTMLACGTSEDSIATRICRPGDPSVDDAVYRALTSASWFDAGCQATGGQPPTCNRVLLDGSGRYTWTAVSDAPERQQAGSWNFRARDATSGLVCLDDGSVLDFALAPDGGLRWGSLGLAREHAASPGTRRVALPTIIADVMFVELTAHGWANTNEMERYRQPTSFVLRDDGTFDATFRDGACTAQGTFSLEREPIAGGSQRRLWSHPAPNGCDTRSGGTPAFQLGDVPRLDDGVLSVGGASYRDAAITTDQRLLRFSSYGGDTGLTVSATWTGALRAGTPTSWTFAVHDDGKEPQAVASLTLDITPVTTASDGTDQAGPTVTAAARALSGTVAPGATLALDGTVAFTPGPAGRAIVHLAIDSAGTTQTYHNQGSFLVELP